MRALWSSHPVGEKPNQPFQLLFNASWKVDFQGPRVTSNGGLILVRELDERLGLSELIDQHLTDSRGNFALRWCGWQTVGSAPDENCLTACEQPRRVYYGAVFKAKEEIPVNV